jgi:hypothetical protein
LRGDPSLATAVWLRLLDALRGDARPWPAIIEMWRRGRPAWEGLYILARPVEGPDLAALLTGAPLPGVLHLDPAVTSNDPALDSHPGVERLTAVGAERLADLWS